ncbi:MAG TPA: polysaccharide pyruvyl transferase family protein [Mobilitalea sp.]|nr:polysaccharide pyruvyl transferase family protein [Mobilitalea sp.]
MRIGILTFHRASNYGAVLQAYALQSAIRKLQPDCEIIDYRNETMEAANHVFYIMSKKAGPKHILAALLNAPLRFYRKMEFQSFRKRQLMLSEVIHPENKSRCDELFDLLVVGSDQVWNDTITGFDKMFFLDIIKNNKKKYSYAASFGFHDIPALLTKEYKDLLASFSWLSVREESGRQIINKLLKRDVLVHVDPTFLLGSDEWERLCLPVKKKGKYILIYSINKNINLIDFAKSLSKQKNLPIIYLLMDITSMKKYPGMKFAFSPSPQKFISLIKDADTVVTNSFHGTAFSVIFRKNFYVEVDYGDKYNDRIDSLLGNLNLRSRIITQPQFRLEEPVIDWEETCTLLDAYRENSIEYLKSITMGAESDNNRYQSRQEVSL